MNTDEAVDKIVALQKTTKSYLMDCITYKTEIANILEELLSSGGVGSEYMEEGKMIQIDEGANYYYRGPLSERFWERVNAVKNQEDMYKLGVMLQNLEEYVLGELLKAEQEAKQ